MPLFSVNHFTSYIRKCGNKLRFILRQKNKDENVHKFYLIAKRGEFFEREWIKVIHMSRSESLKVYKITKLLHNIKVTFMKKVCVHDISIHTIFLQNRSINECARMIWHKRGLI